MRKEPETISEALDNLCLAIYDLGGRIKIRLFEARYRLRRAWRRFRNG